MKNRYTYTTLVDIGGQQMIAYAGPLLWKAIQAKQENDSNGDACIVMRWLDGVGVEV